MLNRKRIVSTTATVMLPMVVMAVHAERRSSAAGPPSQAEVVTALADRYWATWLERNPEFGTLQNIPGTQHDRLEDNSLTALAAWHRTEDSVYARVTEVDADALIGHPERVTLAYLREALESARQLRVCRNELWRINHITGWHLGLPVIANAQPVGSADAREAALRRWAAMAQFADNEVENLREGMRLGYLSARYPVERVIGQVDGLLGLPARESPLYGPARRDSTPEFQDRLARVIAEIVHPALRRYRDFLETEYLPAARSEAAVSANPEGAACYRAAVRNFTTLDMDPRDLFETGMRELEAIKRERARLAAEHGADDANAFVQAAQQDPANRFETRQEIVEYSQHLVERARVRAAEWFNRVPRSEVRVEPFPEFQEQSSPGGMYLPGPPDGSRPGVYRINTYQPDQKSKVGLETLAYHEAIPGHHFQLALAIERDDAHPVSVYLINSGFAEGWALYAERLADEMGLFSSDVQRVAMLNGQLGRAARMVVDPGIHAFGWSRQEALDFLAQLFGTDPDVFAVEVDRYIAWPGQATSYLLGMLEIRRLRERAERALGDRFDVRTFHDLVLEDGAVPLPFLREKIEAWMEEERSVDTRGTLEYDVDILLPGNERTGLPVIDTSRPPVDSYDRDATCDGAGRGRS